MEAQSATLLNEIESSLDRRKGADRVDALRRVTDLFLATVPSLAEPQIDLFGAVIERLTAEIEVRVRAELAERLADEPKAPHRLMRMLAEDDIEVAAPVLDRSPVLTERDLLEIATRYSEPHRLAIAGRDGLSEEVTEALVARSGRPVLYELAENPAAKLSQATVTRLIERAHDDEELQERIGLRSDLSESQFRALLDVAKARVRQRLLAALAPTEAPALGAALDAVANKLGEEVGFAPRDYVAAQRTILSRTVERRLSEHDVLAFAEGRKVAETVCALAALVKLPIVTVDRLVTDARSEAILVLARALNFSWSTTRALLRLKPGRIWGQGDLEEAFEAYGRLTVGRAQRVLRFLQVRESMQRSPLVAENDREPLVVAN